VKGNDVARGLDKDAEKGHDDSATLFILLTWYAAAVNSYCMRTGKVGPQKGARASLETLVAVSVPRSRNKRCLCVCRPTRLGGSVSAALRVSAEGSCRASCSRAHEAMLIPCAKQPKRRARQSSVRPPLVGSCRDTSVHPSLVHKQWPVLDKGVSSGRARNTTHPLGMPPLSAKTPSV